MLICAHNHIYQSFSFVEYFPPEMRVSYETSIDMLLIVILVFSPL
jgi:hypothetical protein